MKIDATILSVERDGEDVVLALGNRIDDRDKESLAGQARLRIKNATWSPEPGMNIWGGRELVQILSGAFGGEGHWYTREGYTTLHERATR